MQNHRIPAGRHYRLEMDHLTETQEPDLAIATARHHLQAEAAAVESS